MINAYKQGVSDVQFVYQIDFFGPAHMTLGVHVCGLLPKMTPLLEISPKPPPLCSSTCTFKMSEKENRTSVHMSYPPTQISNHRLQRLPDCVPQRHGLFGHIWQPHCTYTQ